MAPAPEFGEEELMAFVRGELPRKQEGLINKAMRISPSLRNQIAELRALYEQRSLVTAPTSGSASGAGATPCPRGQPRRRWRTFGSAILVAAFGFGAGHTFFWPKDGGPSHSAGKDARPARLTEAKPTESTTAAAKAERSMPRRAINKSIVTDDQAKVNMNVAVEPVAVQATTRPIDGQQRSDRLPSHVVMLIDASGSMRLPGRLPRLLEGLLKSQSSLLPADLLSIVVYAGAKGELLSPTPLEETESIVSAFAAMQVETLQNIVDSRQQSQSAQTVWGLRQALAMLSKPAVKISHSRIVLVTDGDFQLGVSSHASLLNTIEAQAERGVSFSVLGFSDDFTSETMMRSIAARGNGIYQRGDSVATISEFLRAQFDVAFSP